MAGGKNKSIEKQKNTSRATSSRAAELLGANNQTVNAFKTNAALAFSQFGISPAAQTDFPSAGEGSEKSAVLDQTKNSMKSSKTKSKPQSQQKSVIHSNAQIDDQLANLFKRMRKKDATTRIKTLTELSSYVSSFVDLPQDQIPSSNTENLEGIINGLLIGWPAVFEAQIFDLDRRIRMLSVSFLSIFFKVTKKRSTPCLKQLLGPWICSFFDTNSDVSKTSISIFEENFCKSAEQKIRLLDFCHSGILDFLTNNFFTLTQETCGDRKLFEEEELKERYFLIVSGSFKTFEYLLKIPALSMDPEILMKYNSILSGESLWNKFLSIQYLPQTVLKALYSCFSSWMQREEGSDFSIDNGYRIAYILTKRTLQPSNDLVFDSYIWDSILLAAKNFPSIWTESDSNKNHILYTDLISYIKSGKSSYSQYYYNSMLILLNFIPNELLLEANNADRLLSALWDGAPSEIKQLGYNNNQTSNNSRVPRVGLKPYNKHLNMGTASDSSEKIKLLPNSKNSVVSFIKMITECHLHVWRIKLKSIADLSSSPLVPETITDSIGSDIKRISDLLIDINSTYNIDKTESFFIFIENVIIASSIKPLTQNEAINNIFSETFLNSLAKSVDSKFYDIQTLYATVNFLSLLSCEPISSLASSSLYKGDLSSFNTIENWANEKAAFLISMLSEELLSEDLGSLSIEASSSKSSSFNLVGSKAFIEFYPSIVFTKYDSQFCGFYLSEASRQNSAVVRAEEYNIKDLVFFMSQKYKHALCSSLDANEIPSMLGKITSQFFVNESFNGTVLDYLLSSNQWWRLEAAVETLFNALESKEFSDAFPNSEYELSLSIQCLDSLFSDLFGPSNSLYITNTNTQKLNSLLPEILSKLFTIYYKNMNSHKFKELGLSAQTVNSIIAYFINLTSKTQLQCKSLSEIDGLYQNDSFEYFSPENAGSLSLFIQSKLSDAVQQTFLLLSTMPNVAFLLIKALTKVSSDLGSDFFLCLFKAKVLKQDTRFKRRLSNSQPSLIQNIESTIVDSQSFSETDSDSLTKSIIYQTSKSILNEIIDPVQLRKSPSHGFEVYDLIQVSYEFLKFSFDVSVGSNLKCLENLSIIWKNWFLMTEGKNLWKQLLAQINSGLNSELLSSFSAPNHFNYSEYGYEIQSLSVVGRKGNTPTRKSNGIKENIANFALFCGSCFEYTTLLLKGSNFSDSVKIADLFDQAAGENPESIKYLLCGFAAIEIILFNSGNVPFHEFAENRLDRNKCYPVISELVKFQIAKESEGRNDWIRVFVDALLFGSDFESKSGSKKHFAMFAVCLCSELNNNSVETMEFWSEVLISIFSYLFSVSNYVVNMAESYGIESEYYTRDLHQEIEFIDGVFEPLKEFLNSKTVISESCFALLVISKAIRKFNMIEEVEQVYAGISLIQFGALKRLSCSTNHQSGILSSILCILLKSLLETKTSRLDTSVLLDNICKLSVSAFDRMCLGGDIALEDTDTDTGKEIEMKGQTLSSEEKEYMKLFELSVWSSLFCEILPSISYSRLLEMVAKIEDIMEHVSSFAVSESKKELQLLWIGVGARLVKGISNTYLHADEIKRLGEAVYSFLNSVDDLIFSASLSTKLDGMEFIYKEYGNALISSSKFQSNFSIEKCWSNLHELSSSTNGEMSMLKGYFYYQREMALDLRISNLEAGRVERYTKQVFQIEDVQKYQSVGYVRIVESCTRIKCNTVRLFECLEKYKLKQSQGNGGGGERQEIDLNKGDGSYSEISRNTVNWMVSVWMFIQTVDTFWMNMSEEERLDDMERVLLILNESKVGNWRVWDGGFGRVYIQEDEFVGSDDRTDVCRTGYVWGDEIKPIWKESMMENSGSVDVKCKVVGALLNAVVEAEKEGLGGIIGNKSTEEVDLVKRSMESWRTSARKDEMARIEIEFEAYEFKLGVSIKIAGTYPLQTEDGKYPMEMRIDQGKNIVLDGEKVRQLEVKFRSMGNQPYMGLGGIKWEDKGEDEMESSRGGYDIRDDNESGG
ncbi:hypothetical protein BB560_001545 [Smittium megazygosporum]|uniref:E3 ubiquitin-protein ligase listerin N-terminal domain-containing protein n=1 Tax=Smittium megazygosporum TaxID=133381 RepID=A0A2T9ZH98_9FUNG|nr:hypothetical protein BB560_001545 [Smittium megazygosporum]